MSKSRLEHPATGCSRRSGDASDGLQVLSTAPPAPRRSAHDEACRTFSVGSGVCWRWGRWSGRRSRRVRGAPAAAPRTAGCAEHLRMRSHRTPRCWRQPPVQDAPRGGLQALADGAASPMTPTPRSARLACTRVRGSCRGFADHAGGSGRRTGVQGTGRGCCPRPVGEDPGQRGEPPSRGPRRPPIGGGLSCLPGSLWARTGDTPPPRSRSGATLVGPTPRAARPGPAGACGVRPLTPPR